MPRPYRQKLDHALGLADEAGISRAQSFPPLLQALSTLGLPVRPLHFRSTPGLLAFMTIGLGGLFYLFHALAANIDVNAWAVLKLRSLGADGAIAVGVFCAALAAIFVRYQALSADLPAWRDLD